MVDGETDGFVCQEEAHDEGKSEGDDDAGIGAPETEVIGRGGENLFYAFHNLCNLLSARMTNAASHSTVSSSRKVVPPNIP